MGSPPGLVTSITAAVVTRAMVFVVGLVAVATLGHAPNVGPPPPSELAALPNRWDASWYVGLANGGYRWSPDERPVRIAFFPAYPMALRALGRALRLPSREPPWLWTGVSLSILFFVAGLFYLYRITALLADKASAVQVVWIVACYPFALFYGQVYTESLFLAAAAGSWYFALRQRVVPAMLWGVVAGLTRQTGCLLSLLLAWTLFNHWRRGALGPRPWPKAAITVASPVLGLVAYASYIRWLTGDWLAWVTAQRAFGRDARNPLDNVSDVVSRVGQSGLFDYVQTYPYETVNLLAALFVLAALVPMTRRLGIGCGMFVCASLFVPMGFGGLMAMGRFTSVMFPVFIWLATATKSRAVLGVFAVLQGLLAALFFTDRPIF